MTGAAIGLCLSLGTLLAVSGWRRSRQPSLDQRVLPYVRDVHLTAIGVRAPAGVIGAVFGPSVHRVGDLVGDLLGGAASVSRRLDRLGSTATVEDFRLRQVVWGAAGFAATTTVSVLLWSSGSGSAPVLLIVCVLGFVAGVLWCDHHLSSQVSARDQELQEEFPVVAELLALAVAAGESPISGLERVLRATHGSLTDELGRVLADIRTGASMASAFDRLGARTGVTSIARFAEGLAVAIERGTPLADVLHAQAADVREADRRALMEAGGRREVAMMIPVVFLILPVTVVFAFFPGYIGLNLTSGT